jgi:hypothetical protein
MSRTIRRVPGGHVAVDEEPHRRRYVAVQHFRFGGKWLEPGDPVPFEEGRNYGAMIRAGQIAQVIGKPATTGSKR